MDALAAFGNQNPRDLAAHGFDRHDNREGHSVSARTLWPRLESLVAEARDERRTGVAP